MKGVLFAALLLGGVIGVVGVVDGQPFVFNSLKSDVFLPNQIGSEPFDYESLRGRSNQSIVNLSPVANRGHHKDFDCGPQDRACRRYGDVIFVGESPGGFGFWHYDKAIGWPGRIRFAEGSGDDLRFYGACRRCVDSDNFNSRTQRGSAPDILQFDGKLKPCGMAGCFEAVDFKFSNRNPWPVFDDDLARGQPQSSVYVPEADTGRQKLPKADNQQPERPQRHGLLRCKVPIIFLVGIGGIGIACYGFRQGGKPGSPSGDLGGIFFFGVGSVIGGFSLLIAILSMF